MVQSAPSPVTKLAAIGLKGRQYRRDVFLTSTPAAHRAAIDRPGDILVGRRIKLFGPALFVKPRLVIMPGQTEEFRHTASLPFQVGDSVFVTRLELSNSNVRLPVVFVRSMEVP